MTSRKLFIFAPILLFGAFVLLLRNPHFVQAYWYVDNHGRLVNNNPTTNVLGTSKSTDAESQELEQENKTLQEEIDKDKEDFMKENDLDDEDEVTKPGINTKITEAIPDAKKIHLESKDGQLSIQTVDENGRAKEVTKQDELKIVPKTDTSNIRISKTDDNTFLITKGKSSATTRFPLSIDTATNMLTVQTPSGSKTVTVLPDAAVQNLLDTHIVDHIISSSVSAEMQLEEHKKILVYTIKGIRQKKFLGVLPVGLTKKISVSAENGKIVTQEESFGDKLVGLLSY